MDILVMMELYKHEKITYSLYQLVSMNLWIDVLVLLVLVFINLKSFINKL